MTPTSVTVQLLIVLKCLPLKCDVTKEEDVIAAITETVETFGRIDYAAYVSSP
jgi:NAD(P)-dependent dehydrogenase (short-subunit alcohol dehydrogenase family)